MDYWNDITEIVEDELNKLRKMEKQTEYEAGKTIIHNSNINYFVYFFQMMVSGRLFD